MTKISIHAPLAGCDLRHGGVQRVHEHFNPRTPCGVRLAAVRSELEQANFNPRTPCGVRPHLLLFPSSCCNFNPRTPCGVRRGSTDQALQVIEISIHAPLAGCDRPYPALRRCQANFNPRTPCGVRPDHSPPRRQQRYFNPRTPCGVRRTFYRRVKDYEGFQSTHPLRGATKRQLRAKLSDDISIHAPLAGCDLR